MRRLLFSLGAAALLAACSNDDDGTNPATTPSITLTASTSSGTIAPGASGTTVLTVGRVNGYGGNVSFTTEGAPNRVTVAFVPQVLSGAALNTTATISVASTATPGSSTLTLRTTGSGVTDQTVTYALTIPSPAAPGIAVTLLPTTLSIAQGGSAQTAVTLARTGGLTGDVAMTATGAPAGMTTAFAPTTVTGTSSSLTVTVGAAVAAGTYNLTVTGTAGTVTGTAQLAVTVTVPSGFTLAATNVSVAQGGTTTGTITITRSGGYAGAVQLNSANVPANVNASFSPNPATGGTSALTITAAAGAVVGAYTVTVNGTGPAAANQSTTLTVSVTASGGGGGNIAWRFCDAARVPLWFVYRNGAAGAWTQVTPSANNTFSFTLTGATGSVAYVQSRAGGGTDGQIFMQTTAELQGAAASECTVSTGGPAKTLSGTFAGLATLQRAEVSVGESGGGAFYPVLNYQLTRVADGIQDLFALRSTFNTTTNTATPDRAVLRRGVNYANGATIPVIDFAGAESFALSSAVATLAHANGEESYVQQSFVTSNRRGGSLGSSFGAGPSGTIYGIPTAMLQTGDFHFFTAWVVSTDETSVRLLSQYNRELANRTYTLGNALTLPTVTVTGPTPYARIRVRGIWQAEYPDVGSSSMWQASADVSHTWTFTSSRAFFGAAATDYEFELPDFTGTGFQNAWGFVTASPISIATYFTGYLQGTPGQIQDGLMFKMASRSQTITP